MIINNNAPIDRDYAERNFPNIDIEGFQVTSELDPFYNCFAWAGDDNTINWEPSKSKYVKWFTDSTAWTLENFIENYTHIGYTEISESAELEPDYDKIAIYIDNNNEPIHAARQLEDGSWTSKLGIREDIKHSTLECIKNDVYRKVAVILKRRKTEAQMEKSETKKSKDFENLARSVINSPKKESDEVKQQQKKESQKKADK